jgi:hypothetical protein
MRALMVAALLSTAALPASSSPARAQLMASEPGAVSQTIDGTKIAVEYSRPRARGRRGLFGTRIHWGEVWTPGANAATTLAVGKDVTINGTTVPKGKYSVWMVVSRAEWEMVLDRDTMLFHTQGPKARPGQIRFPAKRETRPFMETLTWWFPDVGSTGATLAMQWDTVYVPLRIGVPASYTRAVSAEVARPVIGRYQMHFEPMGPPPSADTTSGMPPEVPPTDVTFTIRYEGGELRAIMDPPMFTSESGYRDWILLPSRGSWFTLGRIDGGELVEVVDFTSLRFDVANGTARGFEVRTPDDGLLARGKRVP